MKRSTKPNEGLVSWLRSCPEKGYFVPLSTDGHAEPAVHPVDRVFGLLDIGQPVDDAIVAMRGPLPVRRRKKRRSD